MSLAAVRSQFTSYTLGLIEFYNWVMRVKRQILVNVLLIFTVLKILMLPLYFIASFAMNNVSYTFTNYQDDDEDVEGQSSGRRRGNIRYVTRRSVRNRRNSLLALSKGGQFLQSADDENEEVDCEQQAAEVNTRKAAANRVFVMNNLAPPFATLQSCSSDGDEDAKRLQSLMAQRPAVNYRLVRSAAGVELSDARRSVLNKLSSDDDGNK
jgi:hypothetical protein